MQKGSYQKLFYYNMPVNFLCIKFYHFFMTFLFCPWLNFKSVLSFIVFFLKKEVKTMHTCRSLHLDKVHCKAQDFIEVQWYFNCLLRVFYNFLWTINTEVIILIIITIIIIIMIIVMIVIMITITIITIMIIIIIIIVTINENRLSYRFSDHK